MGHNNGIITKPINVRADIAYVLGENSGDVGTLCTSNNIKEWSAHKPVEHSSPGITTDQKFAELKYGLLPGEKLVSTITSGYDGFYWKYQKPTTWFRVLDFDGYNHNAVPPVISFSLGHIYTNVPAEGMVTTTFVSDGNDISMLSIPVKVANFSSAQSVALSSWSLVFIIYVPGKNPQLYNTAKSLSQFAVGQAISIMDAISSSDLGKTVTVLPAMAYPNSEMTEGMHELSGSFMNQYYLVPLSFTSDMESVMQRTVEYFQWLTGMNIGNSEMLPPATGRNYYSFANIGVVATAINGGLTKTNTFKLDLLLDRNGTIYESLTHQEQTITSTSQSSPYTWNFTRDSQGFISFSPSFRLGSTGTYTTPQSGDIIKLRATLFSSGTPATELQQVTKTIQTIN